MTSHRRTSVQCFLLMASKEDWLYSVELTRRFLQLTGAWPLCFCTSSLEKVKSVILTAISSFFLGFLLVPCALSALLDNAVDMNTKLKMTGALSFCVMSTLKYLILVTRGSKVADCIVQVQQDWSRTVLNDRAVKREIMLENAKLGRSITIVCAVFMYFGGFSYTPVVPLLTQVTEIIDNQTVKAQAFPIYRGLLDPRTSPYVEIVQLMQCISGFIVYTVVIGVCSLAAIFAMHACGQFRILEVMLNHVVDGDKAGENDTVERRLGAAVEYHLRILGFITRVEELLHAVCLVEVLGCTVNTCFLMFLMLTEWERNDALYTITYFVLMISQMFNIFILCYIGEILSEQSEKVGLIAYMIEWYRLPDKKASGLILIQAISNCSIKLTAGKFIELTLANFCSILKSSFAYLSLLRTLTA